MPDKDGKFKGISVPRAIPSDESSEKPVSEGDDGDGGDRTRAKGRLYAPEGFMEDTQRILENSRADLRKAQATPDFDPEGGMVSASAYECSFCHGKPVVDGWGWHTGIMGTLPCPRCGEQKENP